MIRLLEVKNFKRFRAETFEFLPCFASISLRQYSQIARAWRIDDLPLLFPPRTAFLPPFAGIQVKEKKLDTAARERLLARVYPVRSYGIICVT
jgi:hypothetical protein